MIGAAGVELYTLSTATATRSCSKHAPPEIEDHRAVSIGHDRTIVANAARAEAGCLGGRKVIQFRGQVPDHDRLCPLIGMSGVSSHPVRDTSSPVVERAVKPGGAAAIELAAEEDPFNRVA
jgi:hypothetical protein